MSDNTQHKLKRVRPPRVKLTYDVETEGAERVVELPLVCGVISDLAGHNSENSSIRDKDFIEVDRDNLDSFLRSINPRLSYSVQNLINKEEKTMAINLSFQSLDDFEIKNVVMQIKETRELYLKMQKLKEVLVKLDGNYGLYDLASRLAKDKGARDNLLSQLKPIFSKQEKESDGKDEKENGGDNN